MPSLARYIRGIRAVGIKEWWHQLQYIGDVKAGTLVGSDQYVLQFLVGRLTDMTA
jgi:NADH dehydrogenase (ubiquinone) 1 alpha subcomplex subunit 12